MRATDTIYKIMIFLRRSMASLAALWLSAIQKKLHPQVANVLTIKKCHDRADEDAENTEPGFHLRDALAILTAM